MRNNILTSLNYNPGYGLNTMTFDPIPLLTPKDKQPNKNQQGEKTRDGWKENEKRRGCRG